MTATTSRGLAEKRRLILGLSRVPSCDAAGLAVLIGAQRRARLLGILTCLAAPSLPVTNLLRSAGLDRCFIICPDRSGTLASRRHEPVRPTRPDETRLPDVCQGKLPAEGDNRRAACLAGGQPHVERRRSLAHSAGRVWARLQRDFLARNSACRDVRHTDDARLRPLRTASVRADELDAWVRSDNGTLLLLAQPAIVLAPRQIWTATVT